MIYDCGSGIFAIDTEYMRKAFTAVYAVVRGSEAALVETAHNASLPIVLDELRALGVAPGAVKYILTTHVHLDHAGGAGLYMQTFKNASLVVHPRGAKHMADPRRLFMGASAVYGADTARRMYGEIVPVPEERMIEPRDGEGVEFGGTRITCLETPGHALHHLAYHLEDANTIFTGDVFGMTCDEFRSPGRDGLLPSTSPVQFDPDAMHASIDRIVAMRPSEIMLTHFRGIKDVKTAADDMHRMIAWHVSEAVEARGEYDEICRRLAARFDEERQIQRWPYRGDGVREWLDKVIVMNAKGLVDWYGKHGAEAS